MYHAKLDVGIGKGKGDNRTLNAVRQAVQSPLLETNIRGATGVIVYVSGDATITIDEVNSSVSLVREVVDPNAKIIFGTGIDENLNDEVMITIIATGFEAQEETSPLYQQNPRGFLNQMRQEDIRRVDSMYGFSSDRVDSDYRSEPQSAREAQPDNAVPPFLQRLRDKK